MVGCKVLNSKTSESDRDVSILCITYNHINFIDQALDSFLSQKTDWKYEIIVSDDASTDGTGIHLKEKYAQNENIKIYCHDVNKGPLRNSLFALSKCSGRYVMICEGDDYWVDENKINTQIDFLEKNLEYFAVYCSAQVIGSGKGKIIPYTGITFNGVEDFLMAPYQIPTCTVAFRNKIKGNIFTYRSILAKPGFICDVLLDTILCEHGKYKFIDKVMGCYRVTTNTSSFSSQSISKSEFEMLETRRKIQNYLNGTYEFPIFISTSFVYTSILVKYYKRSFVEAFSRYTRIPLHYKFGVLLTSIILFAKKYMTRKTK